MVKGGAGGGVKREMIGRRRAKKRIIGRRRVREKGRRRRG